MLWPWGHREYPGVQRLRAWLLGVSNLGTADRYAQVQAPRMRLRIVSAKLRAKASELLALADELDGLASGPVAKGVSKGSLIAPPVE